MQIRAVLRTVYVKNNYIVDAPPLQTDQLHSGPLPSKPSMMATILNAKHKSERLAANAKLRKLASAVVMIEPNTENTNSGDTESVQQIQAGGSDRKSVLQMLFGYNYNKLRFNDSESFLENSLLCLTQFQSIGGK